MENLLQFRPGVLLGEDESNQVHRVRTTITVNAWFASMSAVERGAVVAAAYAAAHAAPQEPEQARSAEAPAEAPSRPSAGLDGEVLRVVTTKVPRGLKWKPVRYVEAEELLAQGATLTKRGADYVTETGGVMSWRTVKALRERGVLEIA